MLFLQGTFLSTPPQPRVQYSYFVKIINPEQRSKFVTKIWHNIHEKFDCPETLKRKLVESFEDKLPLASDLDIGYFEKQGNAKRWIEDQEDLDAMYAAVSVGEEVTLWCNERPSEEQTTKSGKKRKSSETEGNATQSSK